MMRYASEMRLAVTAAMTAGRYLADLETREVESAHGRDIKLKADKASEDIILNILRPSGLRVLSEETPSTFSLPDEPYWIVDPLDGSYNYFKGLDLCCVSVALWYGSKPVLGVVNKFLSNEIYEGHPDGGGCFLNGNRTQVSTVSDVGQASLATGFSVKGDFSLAALSERLRLFQMFKKIRMFGAAAIMSSYVGVGRIDVYFEKDILLWDIAAGAAIVSAAGGIVECSFKDDYKCDIWCFANQELKNSYERTSLTF